MGAGRGGGSDGGGDGSCCSSRGSSGEQPPQGAAEEVWMGEAQETEEHPAAFKPGQDTVEDAADAPASGPGDVFAAAPGHEEAARYESDDMAHGRDAAVEPGGTDEHGEFVGEAATGRVSSLRSGGRLVRFSAGECGDGEREVEKQDAVHEGGAARCLRKHADGSQDTRKECDRRFCPGLSAEERGGVERGWGERERVVMDETLLALSVGFKGTGLTRALCRSRWYCLGSLERGERIEVFC